MSLEAPAVALAWLYMFASAWQVNYLPWPAYAMLGLGVWVVYVVDRLLDHQLREEDDPEVGIRHDFHAKHRKGFVAGVAAAGAVITWLLFDQLPVLLLQVYLLPVVLLVAAFFGLVMISPKDGQVPFLRNMIAGLAFGYGTAMMAHVYIHSPGALLLLFSPEMIGFSILCAINIVAIHLWERARFSNDPDEKVAMEMGLTLPLIVLACGALLLAYRDNPSMFGNGVEGVEQRPRPFFFAILISSALLYLLNRERSRFSLEALRSLADLALIAPLPLFLILSGG